MFDRFIHDVSLRAKSKVGVSGEVVVCLLVGIFLAITALIFLSLAACTWLASIYGSAVAWLIVGGVHLVIAGAAVARGVFVRKRIQAIALAQLRQATVKQSE